MYGIKIWSSGTTSCLTNSTNQARVTRWTMAFSTMKPRNMSSRRLGLPRSGSTRWGPSTSVDSSIRLAAGSSARDALRQLTNVDWVPQTMQSRTFRDGVFLGPQNRDTGALLQFQDQSPQPEAVLYHQELEPLPLLLPIGLRLRSRHRRPGRRGAEGLGRRRGPAPHAAGNCARNRDRAAIARRRESRRRIP